MLYNCILSKFILVEVCRFLNVYMYIKTWNNCTRNKRCNLFIINVPLYYEVLTLLNVNGAICIFQWKWWNAYVRLLTSHDAILDRVGKVRLKHSTLIDFVIVCLLIKLDKAQQIVILLRCSIHSCNFHG